jgi:hypothetical protein
MSRSTSIKLRMGFAFATGWVVGYTLESAMQHLDVFCLDLAAIILCFLLFRELRRKYESHRVTG